MTSQKTSTKLWLKHCKPSAKRVRRTYSVLDRVSQGRKLTDPDTFPTFFYWCFSHGYGYRSNHIFFSRESSIHPAPNKACTGRWGTVRRFEYFSGFEFFLLLNRVRARPSAMLRECNRWARQNGLYRALSSVHFMEY
jgi:hypothetical protein